MCALASQVESHFPSASLLRCRAGAGHSAMKILLVHNSYQQAGGEDTVFEQERQMLAEAGHQVLVYQRNNSEIPEHPSAFERVRLARRAVWSEPTRREFLALLRREKPDIAHVHNTFVVISPSIYWACAEAGIPVVQTLHNYRLFCPPGNFLRDGKVCEDCVHHGLTESVRHACYRGSRAASATIAMTLAVHRMKGTWSEKIDTYIALTNFSRDKLVSAGLPAAKVTVKPNFVHPDPGARDGAGKYALFVGRLSPEKGVLTMMQAWRLLGGAIPLVIAGDGPSREEMQSLAAGVAGIQFRGRVPREETIQLMKGARFLVFPSEWYESFPMTILEAYACGVPVLAAGIGALLEIVEHGRTGEHFIVGNPADLAAHARRLWDNSPATELMGAAGRKAYETRYTAATNYRMLMEIYERTIGSRAASAMPSALSAT